MPRGPLPGVKPAHRLPGSRQQAPALPACFVHSPVPCRSGKGSPAEITSNSMEGCTVVFRAQLQQGVCQPPATLVGAPFVIRNFFLLSLAVMTEIT